MPYISNVQPSSKSRWLISGFSQSRKTSSLITFLYGDYDYWSDEEHTLACEYALGQTMRIISCPGEFGNKSLPPDTEHVSSFYYEASETENITDVRWSIEALKGFNGIVAQVKRERPTIVAYDGVHNLWEHLMNRATSGEYLAGLDLNVNPLTGNNDPYRSARFYSQAHKAFAQYISDLYVGPYLIGVATTLEDWEAGRGENPTGKSASLNDQRYLWPAIPGQMAKQIVSKFDGRLSCQLVKTCLYGSKCEESEGGQQHYTWQFYPKDNVAGVGIKSLRRITKLMKETPYIHQSYTALKQLIKVCQ